MPSRSKAINEYETMHAVSEAVGAVIISLYLGVLAGLIAQLAIFEGIIG